MTGQLPYYHAYVWSTSIITALAIDAFNYEDYREALEICWITRVDSTDINIFSWAVFFVPTLFYYVFALVTLAYAYYRLSGKRTNMATFDVRMRTLYNGMRYVVAFTLYWTIAGIIWFFIYVEEKADVANGITPVASSHPVLYAAFAVTIAIRALIDNSVVDV